MAAIFLKKSEMLPIYSNFTTSSERGNCIHTKSQAIRTSGSWDNEFTGILKIQNGRHFCETQRDADYFAVRQLSQVESVI